MGAAVLSSSILFGSRRISKGCDGVLRMYSGEKPKASAGDTKALGESIRTFLRQRHPTKTAFCVSAEIEIPASTVAKWLEGAATPSLYAGLKLLDTYGPDFVAAVCPGFSFLASAARAERKRQLDEQIAALQAERARL